MYLKRMKIFITLATLQIICYSNADSAIREQNYAGMTSRDASGAELSSTGLPGGSISLYSGQHSEEFPLLVMPASDIGDLAIGLSYFGNVKYSVEKNNLEAPAPWVGLGFSLGFESIISNHRNSVNLDDDGYFFVGPSGGVFELIQNGITPQGNKTFVPSDGRPWIIEQQSDTVSGHPYIVGWTITKDDGVVYKYGDFEYEGGQNKSTRFLLHWGNYVGVCAAGEERRFPHQWDISRVENGTHHFIEYSYEQREERIIVPYNDSHLTANSYTRVSYPKSITSNNGYKVQFVLGTRLDVQPFFNGTDFEFYSDSRLDSIYLFHGPNIISRLGFDYRYLYFGSGTDNSRNKLLLKRIVPFDSSGSVEMSATVFSYYLQDTLNYCGSIRTITYPSGAIKEINYSQVLTDSLYTELNSRQNRTYQGVTAHAFSRNVMISKFKSTAQTVWQYELGCWNGYWDTRIINDITDNVQDSAIVAGENWAAFYNHSNNIFFHFEWQSGNWIRDTIPMSWTPQYLIELHAGNDFIVAMDVKNDGIEPYSRLIKAAYFYKRSSEGWEEFEIFNLDDYSNRFSTIQLAQDLYAVQIESVSNDDDFKLYYGKYSTLRPPGSHHYYGQLTRKESSWFENMAFCLGSDFVAWQGPQQFQYICNPPPCHNVFDGGLVIDEFNGPTFSTGRLQEWISLPLVSSAVISCDFGVVEVVKSSNIVRYWLRSDQTGTWTFGGQLSGIAYDALHPIRIFPSGSNSFGLWFKNASTSKFDFSIFQWNGQSFDRINLLSDMNSTGALSFITPEICAIYNEFNAKLYVSRRINGTNWETPAVLLNNGIWYHTSTNLYSHANFSAAGNIVMVAGDQSGSHDPIRYLYLYNLDDSVWEEHDINPFTDPEEEFCNPFVYGDRAFFEVHSEDMSFFQVHGDSFSGKPKVSVVTNTKLYRHSVNRSEPIIVDYSFNGGILDESATTPRFTLARNFIPKYEGESSEGYTLHRFHNDMDASDLRFAALDTLIGLPDYFSTATFIDIDTLCWVCTQWSIDSGVNPPETLGCGAYLIGEPPCDSTSIVIDTFVADGSGFMFDGFQYLIVEHDSLEQEFGLESLDTTKHYPIASVLSIDPYKRFRIFLDSSHTRTDKLVADFKYIYDDNSSRLRVKKTYRSSLYDVIIDSFHFAYETNQNIEDDNNLSLIDDVWKIRDSAGARTYINRQSTEHSKHGYWRKSVDKIYPDLSDTSSYLKVFEALTQGGFDSIGNLIAWTNANGDTSCAIFDSSGNKAVATAINSCPRDFLIQDFEQGESWGGWNTKVSTSYADLYSGDSVFTGNHCYKLIDNGTSSNARGAERWIHADSLTTKKYYFSCWVRSNYVVRIYCQCLRADSTICTNGDKFLQFTPISPTEWRKVEGVFDLTNVDTNCVEWIKPELVLVDKVLGDQFAYFDDFRFHPIDVSVASKTYDDITGNMLSESNIDNYPTIYAFDEFLQPVNSKDFKKRTLSSNEYYFQNVISISDDSAIIPLFGSGTYSKDLTINFDQSVNYQLEYDIVALPANTVSGYSKISLNGNTIDSISFSCVGPASCSLLKFGQLDLQTDDIVSVKVFANNITTDIVKSKLYFDEYVFDPSSPNYTKNVKFRSASDSLVAISYLDGLGRITQIRTTSQFGNDTAFVSGLAEYDARGREKKLYKPYLDVLGSKSVSDFSSWDSSLIEVNHFFSDSGLGVDCQGYPYTEKSYESKNVSRLTKLALPGKLYSLDSNFFSSFEYQTDSANSRRKTISYDQDGIKSINEIDQWGQLNKSFSYYTRSNESPDSLIIAAEFDIRGKPIEINLDTSGSQKIKLREMFYNDIGQLDSTWKVDYGLDKLIYDKEGNLRFAQNAKRKAENRFIYFKYDKLGRKVEQGRMDSATTYFSQAHANNPNFPSAVNGPVIRYKWIYDQYGALLAPGKLVRVDGPDYYREFKYFPAHDSDLVVVKLPLNNTLKGLKHEYNKDGSLNVLVVYPNYPSVTGRRKLKYIYNAAGALMSIKSLDVLPLGIDELYYATYQYNGDGSIQSIKYGVTIVGSDTTVVQKLDYSYNSLGALVGINKPDSVESSYIGGVEGNDENDHFGMKLSYIDSNGGFANGRIRSITSTNSDSSTGDGHHYIYDYNELGWLMSAIDTLDAVNNRYYQYNALGNRTFEITSSDTISYMYYSNSSGNSRLLRTSDMLISDSFHYDVLGNLVADAANKRYSFTYDERDLMWSVFLESNLGESYPHTSLGFLYDENENRIWKDFTYYYLDDCPDDSIPQELMSGGNLIEEELVSGSEIQAAQVPGNYCAYPLHVYTTYLYDNGVLIATFDGNNNVLDLFVNGPGGAVASVAQNQINNVQYYIKDHLGSTRVTMAGESMSSPTRVSGWYNYHPFGQLLESYSIYNTPFQFTTKEIDDEATFGMYYFGARYYDPQFGRFTSLDKAGQFASGFVYVGNNPISIVDRDGNFAGVVGGILELASLYALFFGTSYQIGMAMHAANVGADPSELIASVLFNSFLTYVSSGTSGWARVGISLLPDPTSSNPLDDFKQNVVTTAAVFGVMYASYQVDIWTYDDRGWYLQESGEIKYFTTDWGEKSSGKFVAREFEFVSETATKKAFRTNVSSNRNVFDISDMMDESVEMFRSLQLTSTSDMDLLLNHFFPGKTFDYKRGILPSSFLYYWDEIGVLMQNDQPGNFLAGFATSQLGYSLKQTQAMAKVLQVGWDSWSFMQSKWMTGSNINWKAIFDISVRMQDWPDNATDQFFIGYGHRYGRRF